MEFRLAKRMQDLRTSEIREMLQVTQRPGMISFAGGLPATELLPAEELAAVSCDVLAHGDASALQYSTTEGEPELRSRIAARCNALRGTRVSAPQVLVTAGSQQGLDLSAKVFLDDGDLLLCESPTYLAALNAFRVYRPRIASVATDDEGMILSALEARLRRETPKLIYVIPDFQNPSGRTWSLERRRGFLDLVGRHGVPVVEDCPYSELYYDETPPASLMSLDDQGLVVQLGTFSKILSPGMRVAWVLARIDLLERYVLVKQGTDLHTSTLAQRQVLAFLGRYDLETRIARARDVYRERRDAMLSALDRCFPRSVRYTRPAGGLFLWVELPRGLDACELLARSLAQGVAFVPGGSFFPEGDGEHTFRLNFSAMPPDRIRVGVERLGGVLERYLRENDVSHDPRTGAGTMEAC